MTTACAETSPLSAECALAQKRGYEELHDECHQTKDVPLPGATGILLLSRCGCHCHDHGCPST
ncbi:hypothetical protein ACFYZ8_35180 [Streptomyces sp. NPDC001668]|uniref:hypothetical protein n=1 Tax=unclassified Streptomyces TaxID=2593676 RepID=UPI0036B2384E